ncbi:hypothetical protein ACLEIY_03055 [Acetobacter tropicalis]|uniref:hypothetical protein n=1 Tax=Acetobacter TaxID=434 RepID=UPI0012FE459A|nr:hypothetical protein [Acetobacter senegalensis]MCG4258968.1 hypothetical protein [Acetobacter senegalensis]
MSIIPSTVYNMHHFQVHPKFPVWAFDAKEKNDDATLKLLFPALNRAGKEWIIPTRE